MTNLLLGLNNHFFVIIKGLPTFFFLSSGVVQILSSAACWNGSFLEKKVSDLES